MTAEAVATIVLYTTLAGAMGGTRNRRAAATYAETCCTRWSASEAALA